MYFLSEYTIHFLLNKYSLTVSSDGPLQSSGHQNTTPQQAHYERGCVSENFGNTINKSEAVDEQCRDHDTKYTPHISSKTSLLGVTDMIQEIRDSRH